MKDKNLYHPNDKLFKAIFSKRAAVIAYLKYFLPKHLSTKLDMRTLKRESTSYLGNDLKNVFSDMVFTCQFGAKEQRVCVSILLEHKSVKEEYVHFQLLKYMLGIWELQIQNKETLTPVIPVLFYHGQENWEQGEMNEYFDENLDQDLLAFIPRFDYIFNDLKQYSDDELKNIQLRFLLNGIRCLKHYRDVEYIVRHFEDLLTVEDSKFQTQLLFFIINRTDIPLERISALASETSNEPLKRNLMTTYEQILAKGEARGEANGEIRGKVLNSIRAILNMHKENFSAKMIASIQEVTEDFVKDVIAGNIKEEDYGRVQKF